MDSNKDQRQTDSNSDFEPSLIYFQRVQLRLLQRRSPNIMVKFVSCSADNQGHAQSVSLSEDSRPQAISYHFQNPQTACFLPLSLCLQWNPSFGYSWFIESSLKTDRQLVPLFACCGTPVLYTVGSYNFQNPQTACFLPLSLSWFTELLFPFAITSINTSLQPIFRQ